MHDYMPIEKYILLSVYEHRELFLIAANGVTNRVFEKKKKTHARATTDFTDLKRIYPERRFNILAKYTCISSLIFSNLRGIMLIAPNVVKTSADRYRRQGESIILKN